MDGRRMEFKLLKGEKALARKDKEEVVSRGRVNIVHLAHQFSPSFFASIISKIWGGNSMFFFFCYLQYFGPRPAAVLVLPPLFRLLLVSKMYLLFPEFTWLLYVPSLALLE